MRFRKVMLLFLILGFGAAVETAWSVRDHVGFGPLGCRVLAGRFYGPSYTFESEETHALPAGAAVEASNAFGAVSVSAGAPGEVKVRLRKVVFRHREEQARAFADRLRLVTERAGDALRVSTNREQVQQGDRTRVGFETHLELTVPPDTPLTVRNEHGAVAAAGVASADVWTSFDGLTVENVAGPVVARNHHGPVTVSGVEGGLSVTARHGETSVHDVTGPATLDTQHGRVTAARTGPLSVKASHGSVEVEDVRGDLEVRAQHSQVSARNVSGRADLESSFAAVVLTAVEGPARAVSRHGRVQVEDARATVSAEASFADVVITRVAGPVEVTVEHGGVRAQSLAQGGRIKASGDEVVVDGFQGALEVDVRRGGARLVPSGPVAWPLTVSTSHGGIVLDVPAGSRFQLEASAQRGEVVSSLDGLTPSEATSSRLAGRVGSGGPLVRLQAELGDVRLERATALAQVASPAASASPRAARSPRP
jgi:hypothetical protein